MRSIVASCVAAMSLFGGVEGRARADTPAELVSTTLVWDGANHVTNPDLIRFGNRWFLACQESATAGWPGGAVRVLTSNDGKAWESAALIESPTPRRGLYAPTFTLDPDGRLMVSALGTLPHPTEPDPLPEFGGMLKTMAWHSKDGRAWGKPVPISPDYFPFDRVVWHNGTAFVCAQGRCCGRAQSIGIMAGKDGKTFENQSSRTFSEFLPHESDLLFEGETAYCLVAGPTAAAPSNWLGTARAPYRAWAWKKLDQGVRHPKFLRLPDKRVLATVGLHDRKPRTSLCQFHPATGKFTELLELPTGNQAVAAGLAWHEGHVWVSYPVAQGDKLSVHLAKVKLK